MSARLMSFTSVVWILSTIICLVLEGSQVNGSPGAPGAEATVFNNIIGGVQALQNGSLFALPSFGIYMTQAIFKMLTWDYSFYTGGWMILRIVFALAFSVGPVWGMTEAFASVLVGLLPR